MDKQAIGTSGAQKEAARQYMIGLIEQYFPSGVLPDPYKGKNIQKMGGRELEELYKDIFHVNTEQWLFEKADGLNTIDKSGLYQIVPWDEETGSQPPEPEEFASMEEAEAFLDKTTERWDGWRSVQIVDKKTGKVVDVW